MVVGFYYIHPKAHKVGQPLCDSLGHCLMAMPPAVMGIRIPWRHGSWHYPQCPLHPNPPADILPSRTSATYHDALKAKNSKKACRKNNYPRKLKEINRKLLVMCCRSLGASCRHAVLGAQKRHGQANQDRPQDPPHPGAKQPQRGRKSMTERRSVERNARNCRSEKA